MQTVAEVAVTEATNVTPTCEREPVTLTKRIGSPGASPALNGRHRRPAPTFIVNVETNPQAKETIADKIYRLIKNECESGKFLLQNMEPCGTINLLRTVRLPGGSL